MYYINCNPRNHPKTFVPKILVSWYSEWANCKGFLEPKLVNWTKSEKLAIRKVPCPLTCGALCLPWHWYPQREVCIGVVLLRYGSLWHLRLRRLSCSRLLSSLMLLWVGRWRRKGFRGVWCFCMLCYCLPWLIYSTPSCSSAASLSFPLGSPCPGWCLRLPFSCLWGLGSWLVGVFVWHPFIGFGGRIVAIEVPAPGRAPWRSPFHADPCLVVPVWLAVQDDGSTGRRWGDRSMFISQEGHTENYNWTKYSSPNLSTSWRCHFVLQFVARQTKRSLFTTRKSWWPLEISLLLCLVLLDKINV